MSFNSYPIEKKSVYIKINMLLRAYNENMKRALPKREFFSFKISRLQFDLQHGIDKKTYLDDSTLMEKIETK